MRLLLKTLNGSKERFPCIGIHGMRWQGGSSISILNTLFVNQPVSGIGQHKVNLKWKWIARKWFSIWSKMFWWWWWKSQHSFLQDQFHQECAYKVCYGFAWNNEIERPEKKRKDTLNCIANSKRGSSVVEMWPIKSEQIWREKARC